MSKIIETPSGDFSIYHRSEAGDPEAHVRHEGLPENEPASYVGAEYFFQPAAPEYSFGDVFSEGYPTEEEAVAACLDYALEERQTMGESKDDLEGTS